MNGLTFRKSNCHFHFISLLNWVQLLKERPLGANSFQESTQCHVTHIFHHCFKGWWFLWHPYFFFLNSKATPIWNLLLTELISPLLGEEILLKGWLSLWREVKIKMAESHPLKQLLFIFSSFSLHIYMLQISSLPVLMQ